MDGRNQFMEKVKSSGTSLILTMPIKWMSVYMHGWLYSSALTAWRRMSEEYSSHGDALQGTCNIS